MNNKQEKRYSKKTNADSMATKLKKDRIANADYDYSAVQKRVNELL